MAIGVPFGAIGHAGAVTPLIVVPPCMNARAMARKLGGEVERRRGERVERGDVLGRELHLQRGQVVVELRPACARR